MGGDAGRNTLLAILLGSLVLSVLVIAASAVGWTQDSAPEMPQLLVTRAAPEDAALDLDVMATRADMRVLSTTLDAAYAMGSASGPVTETEAQLIEAYLLGKAVRAGLDEAPAAITWRGQAFRVELR